MQAFMKLSGPVEDPAAVCDEILMATFASDYSQSNAFLGHVSSFQFILQNSNNNFSKATQALEKMFTQIFGRYFPVATMTVRHRVNPDDQAKVIVTLNGTLTTAAGQQYDLASQILAANGQVMEILVQDRTLWKS